MKIDKKKLLSFIKQHQIVLEDIYNKYISDFDISKKDFYIFAFNNTTIIKTNPSFFI